MKAFRDVYFFSIHEKGKSQISYSLSFSTTNLKVQIEAPLLFDNDES